MKVFIVFDYTMEEVISVFSTRVLAEVFIEYVSDSTNIGIIEKLVDEDIYEF